MFFAICILYAFSGLTIYYLNTVHTITPKARVEMIPGQLGRWGSYDMEMDESSINIIKPDLYLFRNYYNSDEKINLFMGYYNTMEKSDLAHSPLVCYPGSGWEIKEHKVKNLYLKNCKTHLNFNRLIVQKREMSEVVYYWYQTKNYSSASLAKMRIKLVWSKFMEKISSTSFIRLSTSLSGNNNNDADKLLINFIDKIYPNLKNMYDDNE